MLGKVIPLVSLGVIVLGALHAIEPLSAWLIVRQTFIAAGVVALLVRPGYLRGRSQATIVVLLYCYLFAVLSDSHEAFTGFVLTHVPAAVLAASVGFRQLRVEPQPSRLSALAVLLIAGSAGTVSFGFLSAAGILSSGGVDVASMLLLLSSVFVYARRSDPVPARLIYGLAAVPIVASVLMGWWLVGSAIGSYRAATTAILGQDADVASDHVVKLRDYFLVLSLEPLSPHAWFRVAAERIEEDGLHDRWPDFGRVAERLGAWGDAARAYQKAGRSVEEPELALRAALCLFEDGARRQGLAALDRVASAVDDSSSVDVVRAILHSRMGETSAGARILRASVPTGWGLRSLVSEQETSSGVFRTSVRTILPVPSGADTWYATDFDIISLLRAAGIAVLHSDTMIGTTGISAPASVRLLIRPAGHRGLELVQVGETIFSTHAKGITMLALNPMTGSVKRDLIRAMSEEEVLAFLQSVPTGYVVVGVLDGDVPDALTTDVRKSLRELGLDRFPRMSSVQAFIGVQGAPPGSAVDGIGSTAPVSMGVLKANVSNEDGAAIDLALRAAARSAEAGFAVFIEGSGLDASVLIARATDD